MTQPARSRIKAIVEAACARMEVELICRRRDPSVWQAGRWWEGPVGASIYRHEGIEQIWLNPEYEDEPECYIWCLHELEHLVFWHPEKNVWIPENLMMPWAVSVLEAAGIPGTTYLHSDYTGGTQIAELCIGDRTLRDVSDWKRPRQSAWYRRAQRACVEAGVLDATGRPTWRRVDWSRIALSEHE